MENEITPEQYKVERLKQNFANRSVAYEDRIATLETQVAMLEQQLEAATANSGTEDEEVAE